MTIHLVYADYGSTGVFEVEPRYIKDDKLSAKPAEDRAKMFRMEDIVGVCDTDKKAQTAAKRFSKIELAPKKIEGKVEKITSKIERIEAQRDKVEERVDSVGERSNELEESHLNMTQKQQERFDKLCAQYDELSAKYDELDSQIAALENEQATLEEYQELSDAFAFETKDYLANGCLRQILTMGIEDRSDKPYAERIIEEIKEPVHPVAFEVFVPTEIQAIQFPPKIEPTPPPIPKSEPNLAKKSLWNKLCGILKN